VTAPRLSVVVPTRDTEALTLRCLASVARAAVEGTEVVVVDDGGTDGTRRAVGARFPDFRVVARAAAGGFSVAANDGLVAAGGGVVLVLNSDTELAPDALGRLLAAFDRDPRLGAAGAALRHPDGRPQWSGGAAPDVAWLLALASGAARTLPAALRRRRRSPAGVDWVHGAALALRREAWQAAGAFDAGFRCYCQDLDLCLRLRDAGWRVARLDDVHVLHHGGATIARTHRLAATGYVPELLWTDLVRWAAKRGGMRGARRARRALLAGAAARITLRRLAVAFLPPARREGWRDDTHDFERAAAAVRRLHIPA
jgi:GT2 family glycosyltransferase